MKKSNDTNLELLGKVPDSRMKPLIEGYLAYVEKYKYVRYIMLGMCAVIIGYNLFVAGKRFPIGQLNTIKAV